MRCPNCYSENPSDNLYCNKCATPLPQIVDEVYVAPTRTLETPIPEIDTGTTYAGRYQVIEELGRGGMGTVFKVIDTEINEKVALKIIRPEIAADKRTIERFQNEIKLARMISHKNVCRMYHFSKEEDTYYIVMEYVQGESLKSMIRMTKQLSLGTAVNIAKQVCEGLSEAHRLGVVHRDLKPQNIMIDQDGNARIMDFGIARSLKAKGITGPGVMVGTPDYMSPEQVEGKEADQRSDIYSLGIILYEMATGKVPFDGDTSLSIMVKHKNEIPQNPRKINTQIPDTLSRLILKCLDKKKEKRYQNVEELHEELNVIEKKFPTREAKVSKRKPITTREITVKFNLKKLLLPALVVIAVIVIGMVGFKYASVKAGAVPLEDMVSVAVISFENQTGENSYDYLQEAIPNLLITSLEQSRYLRVTTWERMHDLLKQLGKEDVEVINSDLGFEICRMEGINAIVLGSYIKADEMFATNVQVLDVETKELLKSASSRGEGVGSILRNQIDELSKEISRGFGLSERKIRANSSQIAEATTLSMEAYNYFLRGRDDYEKFYFADSLRFLERAVELDPEFVMAHYYTALVKGALGDRAGWQEAFDKFKKYMKKLTGKEGLYAEAIYARLEGKDDKKYFKILEDIEKKYPKEKRVHFDLALYYQNHKMNDEAVEKYNKALELDPKYGYAINQLAYLYSYQNDFDKALEYFKRYASISPGDANPYDSMGELYFRMGKLEESKAKFTEALELKPDFDSAWKVAYIFALEENYEGAMRWVDQYISIVPSDAMKSIGYQFKGFYQHILGNLEQSLKTIDKAEELARSLGDNHLIDVVLRMKLWIYYEWGKTEFLRDSIKARMDFRTKNNISSEKLNTMLSDFYYGVLDLKEGRIKSAKSRLAAMKPLLSDLKSEEDKDMKSSYDYLYSMVLLAEGSVDEAVAVYKKRPSFPMSFRSHVSFIRRNVPFDADFYAQAFQEKGEINKAIAEYEKLMTFNSEATEDRPLFHPLGRFRLAKLYEEKGQYTKAIEQYEKALEVWKNADKGLKTVEEAQRRLAALKSR
ncbi:MAG: protein kinase [Candidatus Aminicenantes bacterium]|nr:protein kinase [Candidatus Aminicenantes bacterium]